MLCNHVKQILYSLQQFLKLLERSWEFIRLNSHYKRRSGFCVPVKQIHIRVKLCASSASLAASLLWSRQMKYNNSGKKRVFAMSMQLHLRAASGWDPARGNITGAVAKARTSGTLRFACWWNPVRAVLVGICIPLPLGSAASLYPARRSCHELVDGQTLDVVQRREGWALAAPPAPRAFLSPASLWLSVSVAVRTSVAQNLINTYL